MTPQLLRVLNKLYKYENGVYDPERSVRLYQPESLTDKEQALLKDAGWQANDIVAFAGHDDIIAQLAALRGHAALSRKRCLDAFVAGLGGSWVRGRAALSAWYTLNNLPKHAYLEKTRFKCCWVCAGHDDPVYENDGYMRYCFYAGNSYASNPMYAYLCLRYLTLVPPVTPTEAYLAALRGLFDLLFQAPADETPGQFEKRLKAAKIIKGDKYSVRGMLDALARVGVIPNQFMLLRPDVWANFGDVALCEDGLNNTKGRSDMEMPWAGWRGALQINEDLTAELFGEYL